jgi:hypothetical protein
MQEPLWTKRAIARAKLPTLPAVQAPSEAELIERSRVAFKAMHDVRSHIDKDEIRAELMEQLLQNQGMPELASRILTQLDFTRENYGENQAAARVYAIELLAQAADRGDKQGLYDTTLILTQVLSEKTAPSKGELRDLEDLLYEYLIRTDLSELKATLAAFPRSESLAENFQTAAAFALRGKKTDAEIVAILAEL